MQEGSRGLPGVEETGDELKPTQLDNGVRELLGQDGRHALEDGGPAFLFHQVRDAVERAGCEGRVRHQADARGLLCWLGWRR